uniref:Actin-related protein 8 n=1 Tax=Alexandrium monilatum TaxID=311494 RepID=A0A7S4UJZ5_9DINO
MQGDLMSELVPTLQREAQRAEAFKAQGNTCFERRDLLGAYDFYSRALKTSPPLPRVWGDLPQFTRLRVVLFSNRALVAFQLGWMLNSIADCSSSIAQNRTGIEQQGCHDVALLRKALIRRAAAWKALDFLESARADLQEALQHGRDPTTAEEELRHLDEERAALPGSGMRWSRLPDEPLIRLAGFLPLVTLSNFRCLDRESYTLCLQGSVWEHSLRLVGGPLGAYEGLWVDDAFIMDSLLHCVTGELLVDDRAKLWLRVPQNLGALGSFPPVVVDVGMGYTKAGLAGAPLPSVLLCNHHIEGRGAEIVNLGMFTSDSGVLQEFFREAVFSPLRADPRRHPVVLCISIFQHRRFSEKRYVESVVGAEEALRALGVPHVCSLHSAALALLSQRRHTGVVVDIGLGVARATPVIRGSAHAGGICVQTIGAANCTNFLLEVLRHREDLSSLTPPSEQLSTYQVMMLVKLTKEELGYVAASRGEFQNAPPREAPALSAAFQRTMDFGRELATVGEMFFTPSCTGPQHSYFGPSTSQPRLGLHQLVEAAVALCPQEHRAELSSAIALAGGTCGLPGMRQRLQRELDSLSSAADSSLAGCSPLVLDVIPEAIWHGGSVAGAELWRTRAVQVLTLAAEEEEPRAYWTMRSDRWSS